MNYYFAKKIKCSFDQAVDKVIEGLNKQGFGVLTEINVKETFKKKLNVDFMQYKILGACNPNFAYQAMRVEDKIGVMLPCNVVVKELDSDYVEVSAIDPLVSMQAIDNPALKIIARQVTDKLKMVIEQV